MVTLSIALTVISNVSFFEHPYVLVPVTTYVPEFEGLNATPFETLLSHVYVFAPEPFSVTVSPSQRVMSFPAFVLGSLMVIITVSWSRHVEYKPKLFSSVTLC